MRPDILAEVTGFLVDQLPSGTWISNQLPDPERFQSALPIVWLNSLPPINPPSTSWGLQIVSSEYALDVDVLGSASRGRRELNRLSEQIFQAFYRIPLTPQLSPYHVQSGGFHDRPDWNPKILRSGAEFTLRYR